MTGVCVCGHWTEEHDTIDGVPYCEGCHVGGIYPEQHAFIFDPSENTKEALAWRR